MIDISKNPIGIFDSGIGGTSIWKEIKTFLPNEDTLYLSDSKNAPYGQKTKDEIINLCIKNTEYLLNNNCKTIVIACNTATTNAITYLRKTYRIPFIGIEPAIKPASLKTKSNVIGILATKGTLNSTLFEKTSSLIDSNITIIEQIGEGLVELIENGKIDSDEMDNLLFEYITPMLEKNVDCLVLGCTHYPYLISKIKKITGPKISIIDSGEAVSKQVKIILNDNNILNKQTNLGEHSLLINKNANVLKEILLDFKNIKINEENF